MQSCSRYWYLRVESTMTMWAWGCSNVWIGTAYLKPIVKTEQVLQENLVCVDHKCDVFQGEASQDCHERAFFEQGG